MKYLLITFLLMQGLLYAQFDIRGSMGINFISTPSLRDYLNQNYRAGEEFSSFNSAIGFSGEADYYFSESFAAGIEFAYIYNSFTLASDIGTRELTYSFVLPSVVTYYVISGTGYNIKLGGGIGVRLNEVKETQLQITDSYTSTGFGFLLKADGNTLLSGNLYANIGTDMRYDLNGSYKIKTGREIKLDALSFGLRLGLTYMFGRR